MQITQQQQFKQFEALQHYLLQFVKNPLKHLTGFKLFIRLDQEPYLRCQQLPQQTELFVTCLIYRINHTVAVVFIAYYSALILFSAAAFFARINSVSS